MAVRFLLVGDVRGHIERLVEYIEKANHAQGPFQFVIAVGAFTPDVDDADGNAQFSSACESKVPIPLPVYVVDSGSGNAPSSVLQRIHGCANLHLLCGLAVETVEDIRVAFLSGRVDQPLSDIKLVDSPSCLPFTTLFHEGICDPKALQHCVAGTDDPRDGRCICRNFLSLRDQSGLVDVLVTCQWPAGIEDGLDTTSSEQLNTLFNSVATCGSSTSSFLASYLKPRYHISATNGIFYQRPQTKLTTGLSPKFIGLGKVRTTAETSASQLPEQTKAKKFIHALALAPLSQSESAETVEPEGGCKRGFIEATSPAARPSRFVFISNIPYDVDFESLLKVLKTFGGIKYAHAPQSDDGQSTGKMWVEYVDIESAAKLVALTDQLESGSRRLKIAFHHPKRTRDDNPNGPPNWSGDKAKPKLRGKPLVDIRSHADCWFCLGNPNCEKHLVLAVGKHAYVALAKGGIVENHIMIVPIQHIPNVVYGCDMTKRIVVSGPLPEGEDSPLSIPGTETLSENTDVLLEVLSMLASLRECFSKELDSDMVAFERFAPMSSTLRMHTQIHLIAVPRKYNSAMLEEFEVGH
eukprot:GHVN01053129.1.p1 GENE.GHVN01053129.1~~GHVN01053129.1.p1  ORF type:complete len:580 (+),score=31.97 GHVN01053129.1:1022-2761(+)